MNKKIGIIGLGIGSMYKRILDPYYEIVTIDIDAYKSPDFLSIDDCLKVHHYFDLIIVATPTYLHKEQYDQVADHAKIVLIEKPGFVYSEVWERAYEKRKNLFMTKNNMYREEFPYIKDIIDENFSLIERVNITWINKSRVPFPGFWFTDKSKAFGGTSKDSFPHLLSEFYYLFRDYPAFKYVGFNKTVKQNFQLKDVLDTDYGIPNPDGIYDVDDYARVDFKNLPVTLIGCWKSPTGEDTKIGIEIEWKTGEKKYIDFELCPEYCYFKQFNYFLNITDDQKREQFKADMFIHQVIEQL